ncbi:hypothetical protein [Microcoleus sp. D3_18a_C4]|uniref:hypothetical protein n=1 Tax=unclassified Microcoleus TaxID=2642155 RepID=UPI002FD6893D
MNIYLKKRIIPSHWKAEIDDFIDAQLLNANRYFAETHILLGKLVNETLKEEPQTFYENLVQRWKWHHTFYEEYLEPALLDLIEDDVFEISPRQLDFIVKIYHVCVAVDKATLVYSAAIKKYVQNWIDESLISDEIITSLITPNEKSFF